MTDDWSAKARAHRSRVSAIWRNSILAGLLTGGLAAVGVMIDDGAIRLVVFALAAIAAVTGIVLGTRVYMRTIDEQERDANLWATYSGMTVYLTLYLLQMVARDVGVVLPHVHDAIFTATMIVVLGVFCWKRFR